MNVQVFIEFLLYVGNVLFLLFVVVPYYWLKSLYHILNPSQPKSVKGEIVLITGTGHGIGKELALMYAANGATVVGWDINESNNEETMRHLKSLGFSLVYAYKCDVSNRKDVLEVAKKVLRDVGEVTILINNAGIMPTHSFLDHTPEEIDRIIRINVFAHFWTLEAFLPAMKKNNHGHVVCLSSMAGLLGLNNLVPYCASKYAVRGLMEGLEEEFRRIPNNRVHFTTICPFMVDTGLCKRPDIRFQYFNKVLKQSDVAKEIFKAQVTNQRLVKLPPEIGIIFTLIPKTGNAATVSLVKPFICRKS
ncbi:short-chain dehydrogenase/reductase family 16C member 6-like isoform X2 [Cylas formicarius]|uniref:short-chain dehydrogenase/reductase family 16C member 6-like isoform X2 n=1 Tax=Cylas formicarius TaxID=197179 RepID=UPI002958DD38|nr:short-chain dehydrogenase/reductase family 16C member 6-like isoform X2 [Cylas formicarius]